MSQVEPKPEVKEHTDAEKEKQRLLILLHKEAPAMVADYKSMIRHTGGLLTTSMTYAYSKGLNDALKLLTKDTTNEKSV